MGKRKGIQHLIPAFPGLYNVDHEQTSDASVIYNCIAYAADDNTQKWDCTAAPPELPLPAGFYWPNGAKRGHELDALISAFRTIGYEICNGPERESGYEKVALYADAHGNWTHAAKQRQEDGHWSSKLGDDIDIRHESAEALCGQIYGNVMCYMRRPLLCT
ncbi:MAG: hypothetical protein JXB10_08730 [Pirellulales bacterium]|nr:hypothetical protein [Pirellulales bacterium]